MSFSIYVTEKVFTSYEFDTEDAALQAMAQVNLLYQEGQVLGSEVIEMELIDDQMG